VTDLVAERGQDPKVKDVVVVKRQIPRQLEPRAELLSPGDEHSAEALSPVPDHQKLAEEGQLEEPQQQPTGEEAHMAQMMEHTHPDTTPQAPQQPTPPANS
jgi:hypothetical protein